MALGSNNTSTALLNGPPVKDTLAELERFHVDVELLTAIRSFAARHSLRRTSPRESIDLARTSSLARIRTFSRENLRRSATMDSMSNHLHGSGPATDLLATSSASTSVAGSPSHGLAPLVRGHRVQSPVSLPASVARAPPASSFLDALPLTVASTMEAATPAGPTKAQGSAAVAAAALMHVAEVAVPAGYRVVPVMAVTREAGEPLGKGSHES